MGFWHYGSYMKQWQVVPGSTPAGALLCETSLVYNKMGYFYNNKKQQLNVQSSGSKAWIQLEREAPSSTGCDRI
jgi:hypothetical protein